MTFATVRLSNGLPREILCSRTSYGLHTCEGAQLPLFGPPSAEERVGVESAPTSIRVAAKTKSTFFTGETPFMG